MKIDKHEIDYRINRLYVSLVATYNLTNAIKIVNGLRKKLTNEKKRRKELE